MRVKGQVTGIVTFVKDGKTKKNKPMQDIQIMQTAENGLVETIKAVNYGDKLAQGEELTAECLFESWISKNNPGVHGINVVIF